MTEELNPTDSGENKGIFSTLPEKTLEQSLVERTKENSDDYTDVSTDAVTNTESEKADLKQKETKTDKHWLFKKGESGNPAGKPKGTRHFTSLVREALQKIAVNENGEEIKIETALVNKVVSMALKGDTKMITLTWNYLDGLPQINLDHTTDGKELPVPILQIFNKQGDN